MIYLDDFRLAEVVATRLQQEAGLGHDDCETFRELTAIRPANLSKEDIALATNNSGQFNKLVITESRHRRQLNLLVSFSIFLKRSIRSKQ